MADIREQILNDNMGARLFRSPALGRLSTTVKLALRRFVLATSRSPLRAMYHLIYQAHVWHGVRVLRRLPGVRAIYVTRGVASGDIVPGISDVDFAIFGDWTDGEHAQVAAALRKLSASSPLYERELWREARTVSSIRSLYDSDFSLMSRLDEGRTRWVLRYGDHVLATLPPPPATRVAGGYYMELRLWWSYLSKSAFGTGVLATDAAFRNSVCYKVVSESLAKIDALPGGPVEPLRRRALAKAVAQAPTEHQRYLERLQHSGAQHHRRFDGDIHEETLRFMLPTLERVHAAIGGLRAFEPIAASEPLRIDAPTSEMLRTPEVEAHAARLIGHVKSAWLGYRAAYLTPCVSFYFPDDVVLLFDVDPAALPSVAQIREVNRLHAAAGALRQRVTLFLLLPEGAYQIEAAGPLDLWHLLMCRGSNPDLFELVTRPELGLDGPPRPITSAPIWTRFASALVDEELGVRRSAMAKAGAPPEMSSLDLLRHVWRHLQLEMIAASTRMGRPVLPLTPQAVGRALAPFGWLDPTLVDELTGAYRRALAGEAVDIRPQLARLRAAQAQRANSR